VVPHLVDEGLPILQYANGKLFFADHDLEHAKYIKLLLNNRLGSKSVMCS